jgi:hypothetical protein
MDHTQLELFADRSPTPWASNLGALRRLVPENLSDAALVAALPDALLADACALAAEAKCNQRSIVAVRRIFFCSSSTP